METTTRNANRAIEFMEKSTKRPLYAFDCSGLGMYWIEDVKKISNVDMNSNSMYNKCEKLSKNELRKGDWVFRHNGSKVYHIGYVVDDDLNVVESMGRDDGVVKRSLDASGTSYWNRFGRPVWVFPEFENGTEEYDKPEYTKYGTAKIGVSNDTSVYIRKKPVGSTSSSNTVVKVSNAKGKSFSLIGENGDYYFAQYGEFAGFVRKCDFDIKQITIFKPFFAIVTGGSVNVRRGAGSQYTTIGTAHKDDKVLALPQNVDWSQISIVIDGEMITGFISNKYIKKV